MGDTLRISRSVIEAIVAEAAGSAVEVCGLLFRSGDCDHAVDNCLACRNVAADPATHFEIDPVALIAAHRAARDGGPVIVGHYHSHPSGDPAPSVTDAAQAAADGSVWLIAAGDRVAAWRAVRDGAVHGRFDPVEMVIA